MNAISKHSQNKMNQTYARRRIIVANDKPPLSKGNTKISDYVTENTSQKLYPDNSP